MGNSSDCGDRSTERSTLINLTHLLCCAVTDPLKECRMNKISPSKNKACKSVGGNANNGIVKIIKIFVFVVLLPLCWCKLAHLLTHI